MRGEIVNSLPQCLYIAKDCTRHCLVGMNVKGHSSLWGPNSVKQNQLGQLVEDSQDSAVLWASSTWTNGRVGENLYAGQVFCEGQRPGVLGQGFFSGISFGWLLN